MAVEFVLSEVGGIAQLILLSPKQANQAAGDAGVKIGAEVKRRAQQAEQQSQRDHKQMEGPALAGSFGRPGADLAVR